MKCILNICRVAFNSNNLVLKYGTRSYSNQVQKRVFLHDFHLEKGAKMVDFGGFLMPLQYAGHGIADSHMHTRQHVSVFDVSHMLQLHVKGKDRLNYIESVVVSDIKGLKPNQGTLTLLTNESGGIIDDLIVTNTDRDYLYVVCNAGCTEKDLAHLKMCMQEFKSKNSDVDIEVLTDKALLAVQGPGAMKVLQPLVSCNLTELMFMSSVYASICNIENCRITRCGYTGEDGFEISVPAAKSKFILETLLESKIDSVKLAGLGARDTLRLEAGLCLYGNDITENTTPVEAGLTWTIGKRRRAEGGFPGDKLILEQLKQKPSRKRIGFVSTGPCPRSHTPIMSYEGSNIGEITSGCPSFCLNKNISMGYVPAELSKIGTKVNFCIHKKLIPGEVAKMPFVPTKYYVK